MNFFMATNWPVYESLAFQTTPQVPAAIFCTLMYFLANGSYYYESEDEESIPESKILQTVDNLTNQFTSSHGTFPIRLISNSKNHQQNSLKMLSFFRSCCCQAELSHTEFTPKGVEMREESPHQLIDYHHNRTKLNTHVTNAIANKFEVRGAWHHNNEKVDYSKHAYKQEKYREFIRDARKDVSRWNECYGDRQR